MTLVQDEIKIVTTRPGVLRRLSAGVRNSPARAFGAVTLLYILICAVVSHYKLLWLDELITLHIARLGSVRDIWLALAGGADPNPPLTHILVHASRLLFGESAFALRLPALCGYWLGLLALFSFLTRRVPAVWALAGTVLSMTMAGFDFSFESRSYALLYGFTMVALLCWTLAVEPGVSTGRRVSAMTGMLFALSAALSTNYFAVLAFVPIAAGEAVRLSLRAQQPQRDALRSGAETPSWAVWLALLLALAPLLVFRAQINHSIAQFGPHAWNKVSVKQVVDSYMQMVEIVLYPLLALFLLYAVCRCSGPYAATKAAGERLRSLPATLPVHERAAVWCLVLYPVAGYLVATLHGGMLSPRFVVPVCLGFAIAGTLAAHRLAGHIDSAGAVLLCFLLCWFVARETYVGYTYQQQRESFARVENSIAAADTYLPGHRPLAVPDPLMVLTLQYYAPPKVSSRIVFPVDFPAIWKFRGDDSPEQNIWAGKERLYPVPIITVAQLQRTSAQYLILATEDNWLLKDLGSHGYATRRLPVESQADEIKGFTPLMHGLPVFYIGEGDLANARSASVTPFLDESELPAAQGSKP